MKPHTGKLVAHKLTVDQHFTKLISIKIPRNSMNFFEFSQNYISTTKIGKIIILEDKIVILFIQKVYKKPKYQTVGKIMMVSN